MAMQYSDVEIRVLGSLVEKSMATPEYYPLTLNALVLACNQKSNRDPAMQLDEAAVMQALDRLRYELRLVWNVTVPGQRAVKYRHALADQWQLTPPQLAVLCELMLRGPQTVGELRNRADRLHPFPGLAEVEAVLQELGTRPAGVLVTKLAREPGRKEPRYTHLLAGAPPPAAAPPEPAAPAHPAEPDRLARLEAQVAALKQELAALQAQWAEFIKR